MRKAWLVVGLVAGVIGCDGGDEPDGGAADAASVCRSDESCDDGLFCNGVERCAPDAEEADAFGCVPGGDPCIAGQRCDDAMGRCLSNCAVVPDADGDGADAIECGGADCDDTNPNRFPGNVEVCDAADVDEDCDPTTFGDRDADSDGFVDATCCNEDAAGARRCGDDCSDHRRDMRPGFAETCDFLDNDCDGEVDEAVSVDGFADEDRDLHGDPSAPMTACPDTPGFSVTDDDCDDADPEVHGAQLEICDRKDNDCDALTDETPAAVTWYADQDDDGFGAANGETRISCDPIPGFSLRSSDCDDVDRGRNPAAREICNARDDDCNGRADFMLRPGDFEDDDADGYPDRGCGGNDCDDADPNVQPGAVELCDGIDNDCDGLIDGDDAMANWYLDLDGDGYGDESMPAIESCEPQPARVPRGGDCDDSDASVHPGVPDRCDGQDADCDGATDEDSVRLAYYVDGDGDGFGDSASSVVFSCLPSSGRADRPGDCDDSDATSHPGATELCDLRDNDCDGEADEDAPSSWYPDADGDGHGVTDGALETCSPPAGYAELSDDCDDGNGTRFPGNGEACDLTDNDCDATVDEGADAACGVSNGAGECVRGACELTACTAPFEDCDGLFASGCEVNTSNNPRHCGGCGASCALGDTCGRISASACDRSAITALYLGDGQSFALRSTGGLLGWGENNYGQIGAGGTTDVPAPVLIRSDVLSVSAGLDHSCAVDSTRRAWCWGRNYKGQIGSGTSEHMRPASVVSGLSMVRQVEAGGSHSCALRTDGAVFCWGDRTYGQLGDGVVMSSSRSSPAVVPSITDAVEIVAGEDHTCARRPLGGGGWRVQCWGSNYYGELAMPTTGSGALSAVPVDVEGLPSDIVSFVPGFANHTCVRLSSGTLRCWGRNALGALGNGSTDQHTALPSPGVVTEAGGAEAAGIVAACAGQYLTCALRTTGAAGPGVYSVWCTGGDDFGQLGDGVVDPHVGRLQPVLDESGAAPFDDATVLGCGRNHVCAGRADGSVYCWGSDANEKLGTGPGTLPSRNPLPLRVVGL